MKQLIIVSLICLGRLGAVDLYSQQNLQDSLRSLQEHQSQLFFDLKKEIQQENLQRSAFQKGIKEFHDRIEHYVKNLTNPHHIDITGMHEGLAQEQEKNDAANLREIITKESQRLDDLQIMVKASTDHLKMGLKNLQEQQYQEFEQENHQIKTLQRTTKNLESKLQDIHELERQIQSLQEQHTFVDQDMKKFENAIQTMQKLQRANLNLEKTVQTQTHHINVLEVEIKSLQDELARDETIKLLNALSKRIIDNTNDIRALQQHINT